MACSHRALPARRGFTIVELLVVITVIAILAMMLTPVVRAVRRTAKTTACLNNVKQCAGALHFYLEDSREHCPPWIPHDRCVPVHGNAWWTTIHYLLQVYADEPRNCWTCPADDTQDCTPWDGGYNGGDRLSGYRNGCSYFYNNGGGNWRQAAFEGLSYSDERCYRHGKHCDDIPNPSRKIAMCCWSAHNFWPVSGGCPDRQQWWHSDPPDLRVPLGFLDLRAEAVVIQATKSETPQYRW